MCTTLKTSQPSKLFSRMLVMHTMDTGPYAGFIVRNDIPGASPVFVPNHLVATTPDRAEQRS